MIKAASNNTDNTRIPHKNLTIRTNCKCTTRNSFKKMRCTKFFRILTYIAYVAYLYILDTYRRNDNRRSNKRRMIKTQEGRHKKTSLQLYFTSHFIASVRKGCSRFACERVLETEHKLHILTPLLWPSRCVFLVLLMLGSTPSGVFRGPPRSGVASLPHLVSSCLEFYWQMLWDPNSTELNNNATPTRSPTGSLKSNV